MSLSDPQCRVRKGCGSGAWTAVLMDLLEEVDEEKDIHQDETSVEMCWGITPMGPEKVRQQEDRDVADELRAAVNGCCGVSFRRSFLCRYRGAHPIGTPIVPGCARIRLWGRSLSRHTREPAVNVTS